MKTIYRKRPLFIVLHASYGVLVLIGLLSSWAEYIGNTLSTNPNPYSSLEDVVGPTLILIPIAVWAWLCINERIEIEDDSFTHTFWRKRQILYRDIRRLGVAVARLVIVSAAEKGSIRLTLLIQTTDGKICSKFLYPFNTQEAIPALLSDKSDQEVTTITINDLPSLIQTWKRL